MLIGSGNWKLQFPSKNISGGFRLQEKDLVFTRVHNDFLEVWAEIQLPRMSQSQLKAIGLIIEHFGNSIQECPLGQRRWNLEIAIT